MQHFFLVHYSQRHSLRCFAPEFAGTVADCAQSRDARPAAPRASPYTGVIWQNTNVQSLRENVVMVVGNSSVLILQTSECWPLYPLLRGPGGTRRAAHTTEAHA